MLKIASVSKFKCPSHLGILWSITTCPKIFEFLERHMYMYLNLCNIQKMSKNKSLMKRYQSISATWLESSAFVNTMSCECFDGRWACGFCYALMWFQKNLWWSFVKVQWLLVFQESMYMCSHVASGQLLVYILGKLHITLSKPYVWIKFI